MAIRVLLVEDDTLTRRNTAIYLRRAQFEVDEAANGDEAIRLITSIDDYDAIVSDLRMAGGPDGMDVIACQQRVSPGTPSILVTAFGSDQLLKLAQNLNIDYLEKPISLTELVSRIRASTTRSTP
jgi:two-component system, OmpR family, response regulator ResD